MLPMDFTCETWDEVFGEFLLVDFSKKNTISLVGTWIVSWGGSGLCCWIVESWLGPTGSILKTLGGMPGRHVWERRGKSGKNVVLFRKATSSSAI